MNHLRYSFFICNKPLENIEELTSVRVGQFFIGCAQGALPVSNGAASAFFSFETMELQRSSSSTQNTVLINDRTLSVYGSFMNTQAIYFIEDSSGHNLAIFNDLFLARPLLKSLGLPVLYTNDAGEELTFFKHVRRLKCGEQLNVRLYGSQAQWSVVQFADFLRHLRAQYNDLEQSKSEFYKTLDGAVKYGLENALNVNIALSGGVDSGSIAALLKANGCNVKAYTVSTDWGDEYEAAKETAGFLGIELDLVHITTAEIIREVPNVIRYFHFTSPESIEIALVAHCLYKKLQEMDGANRTFFTGYGSDLLNAGVYTPFEHYNELHADCMKRVRATQLSNEFSNLSALNHAVKVYHPFWQDAVISTALRVPAEFKVRNGQDKFYFRQMMEGKLPGATAWRKKLGAHHGTGLSQHLQNALGEGRPGGYQQAIKKIHEQIFCYGNYDYQNSQARRASQPLAQVG